MTLDEFFDADGNVTNDDWPGAFQAEPIKPIGWERGEPVFPERAGREGDSQPLPIVHSDRPDIQSLVIADIEARREIGIRRYGTALQADNGRDAVTDAYEEALDLATYLRQVLEEDLRGRVRWLAHYTTALEAVIVDCSPIHHQMLINAAADVANAKAADA